MPRGIPKAGFRKTRNSLMANKTVAMTNMLGVMIEPEIPEILETDEEIEAKLSERFEVLSLMTDAALAGDINSLIISGPAGLGKSFSVEKALEDWDPNGNNYRIVKGYLKAVALFKLLYQYRAKGQVLVFDDADKVFLDEIALNLLKAALDSTERRIISYMSEYVMIDEETAEQLPKSFRYEGTIIFLTNYNFSHMISRGGGIAPHLEALMSRSHYVDLAMKTRRDYFIRIRQVVRGGMLRDLGMTTDQEIDVMDFIEVNQDKLNELSLRMAIKLAALRRMNSENWRKVAKITCCKVL